MGNKLVVGINDLATMRPNLVIEWNYEKNGSLLPTQVLYSSGRKVWWKCKTCGFEWQVPVRNRTERNSRCPVCANRIVMKGYNDLLTKRPDLMVDWDYENNGDLLPTMIIPNSWKKVWWKCNVCGHKWQTRVINRNKGFGCPECGKRSIVKKLSTPHKGKSLQDLFPKVVEEWDYVKNKDLLPSQVNCGFGRKVWWKCSVCGYEWQAEIYRRVKGHGCPVCSPKGTSFSEQAVYLILKLYFSDALNRFKLEDENGKFEVDVYLPSVCTAIEYDGAYWHYNKEQKDKEKEKRVKSLQIKFYRIIESNKNVVNGSYIYYDYYGNHFENLTWAIKVLIEELGFGSIFVDVKANEQEIRELFYRAMRENSLAVVNPKISKEWHPTKNGSITPMNVSPSSNIKVWWKCSEGHEWQASVSNRVKNHGCPYCSGRFAITGTNDFATLYPQFLNEWDYDKNDALGIYPNKTTYSSSKKVWWKCNTCGYEWQAVIYNRIKGVGCPKCGKIKAAKSRSVPNFGKSLQDRFPNLVIEWNYKKNGDLLPSNVNCGSHKKVWWQCVVGHEWQATVHSRTSQDVGCPYCSNKKVLVGYNDLVTVYPKIAEEWDYGKNNKLLPTMVVFGSNKRVWWKCKYGHEWQDTVGHRSKGRGCPKCAKLPKKGQSLQDKFPNLAKEWHPTKNGDLSPSQIAYASGKKVWWRCEKGHEWKSSVGNRSRSNSQNCPICANRQLLVGYNDLATVNPKLCEEWNYGKNGDLLPTMVMSGSDKRVWWKCGRCGYEWQTKISHRVHGTGCPNCWKIRRRKNKDSF